MFDFLFKKRSPRMSIRQIDNSYHVAGQISPDAVAAIKEAGYKAIICMRPEDRKSVV
jgi:protein tyrosine phosphatase (PTP) superfamily phosphohydrolase (DUF442 family)